MDGSELSVAEVDADVVPESNGNGAEAFRHLRRYVVGFAGSSK